jgi:hypothetical protein
MENGEWRKTPFAVIWVAPQSIAAIKGEWRKTPSAEIWLAPHSSEAINGDD